MGASLRTSSLFTLHSPQALSPFPSSLKKTTLSGGFFVLVCIGFVLVCIGDERFALPFNIAAVDVLDIRCLDFLLHGEVDI